MPNAYFTTFELLIYLLMALCLHHALTRPTRPARTRSLLRLLSGTLYGVALEETSITLFHGYVYGRFWLMVADVPLCIGVAWSCIIYSAIEFSDASSLPYWSRPTLDALLGLNIDLALDAVAIRLGFWDWGEGMEYEWFGVPYANFWGWFWVVFYFSLGHRILSRREDWIGTWLSPVLAFVVGLVGLFGTDFLVDLVYVGFDGLAVSVLIGAALCVVVYFRPSFSERPTPGLVLWVPLLSHLYVTIAGLVSHTILRPPFLLFVGLLMLAIGLGMHCFTVYQVYLGIRRTVLERKSKANGYDAVQDAEADETV